MCFVVCLCLFSYPRRLSRCFTPQQKNCALVVIKVFFWEPNNRVRQGCTQHALHLPCCLLFPTRHRTLCDAHAQRLKVSLAKSTM